MKVCIEGFRSQNKSLTNALWHAAWFYGLKLMGGRMARNLWIDIKLVNKLKQKTGAYAFCSVTGDLDKPREFEIEIDSSMVNTYEDMLIWLAHEMVHVKQFVRVELIDWYTGGVQWKTKCLRGYTKYEDMPWEKEAYRLEEKLYDEYKEYLNE